MDDELYHYGVLGMKWGVRKDRNNSPVSRKIKRKNRAHEIDDEKRKAEIQKRREKIKKISDSDLQSRVRRLQLEKQYRDLKKDEVSTGKKILGEILKVSGRTLGIQVANYIGGKAINALFGDEVIKTGSKKKKNQNKETNSSTTATSSSSDNSSTASSSKSKTNTSFDASEYKRRVNEFVKDFVSNNKTNNKRKAAEAVIVDVQDVKVNDILALPAPSKKRRRVA